MCEPAVTSENINRYLKKLWIIDYHIDNMASKSGDFRNGKYMAEAQKIIVINQIKTLSKTREYGERDYISLLTGCGFMRG